QPLVRTWGRIRHSEPARREMPAAESLPGPVHRLRGGVLLFPEDRARADLASIMVTWLRRSGLRVVPASGWENFDARIIGSALVLGAPLAAASAHGVVDQRGPVLGGVTAGMALGHEIAGVRAAPGDEVVDGAPELCVKAADLRGR